MRNLEKKIAKILPASSIKKSVHEKLCFAGKNCLFEIVCILQKTPD
jgi:hypothetical protein